MTLKEQMDAGKHIFEKIDSLFKENRFQEAYEYIQTESPPECWLIELDSISKKGSKYKTIKLELMEAVMRRIFGKCEICEISSPVICQDKMGNFAATITVNVKVDYIDSRIILPGIATEVVGNINLLPLAIPKASSMAVKNAIKQTGRLLGKYLNNEAEEIELPIESSEKILTKDEEVEAVQQGIISAKTLQDLKSWRHIVFSRSGTLENQNLYETRLREFKN
jgi:hypothetical protein